MAQIAVENSGDSKPMRYRVESLGWPLQVCAWNDSKMRSLVQKGRSKCMAGGGVGGVGEGTCEQNPGSHAKQQICVCTMLAQCSPPLRHCFMSRSLLPLSFAAVSFSVKPSWSKQINVDPHWICPWFLYVTRLMVYLLVMVGDCGRGYMLGPSALISKL